MLLTTAVYLPSFPFNERSSPDTIRSVFNQFQWDAFCLIHVSTNLRCFFFFITPSWSGLFICSDCRVDIMNKETHNNKMCIKFLNLFFFFILLFRHFWNNWNRFFTLKYFSSLWNVFNGTKISKKQNVWINVKKKNAKKGMERTMSS